MPKRDRSSMQAAVEEIRRRILDLELRPGQRVDDIGLSVELKLSRTPVREALFQLSSEGLIDVGPRGGFVVRGLDLLDIRELFEAHLILARSVARLVVARATDADLQELETANDTVNLAVLKGEPSGIARANSALHQLEARIARNAYLGTLAGRIHSQGQRLAFLSFGGDGLTDPDLARHYQIACDDHAASLLAFRARDADLAEEIAGRHVNVFRNRITTFLDTGLLERVTTADLADAGAGMAKDLS